LINKEDVLLGVLELQCSGYEDDRLFDSVGSIALMGLERVRLRELAVFGYGALNIEDFILPDERAVAEIPASFRLSESGMDLSFDAARYDGIGAFKIVFAMFKEFDLMIDYRFNNQLLFNFLNEVRQAYNRLPDYNWRHAVDVLQFIASAVKRARLQNLLAKFDLFALFVAALCHDIGHEGFSTSSEIPLSVLFNQQSVLEARHCSITLSILSKPECDVFCGLEVPDRKLMWNQVIQLILATDMAKHFKFIADMGKLIQSGDLRPDDNSLHRLLLMQNLLKCGDFGSLARPMDIAEKSRFFVAEEFFRQGEVDKMTGLRYEGGTKDREHIDREGSFVGFCTTVALPLFDVVAKAVPTLELFVTQIKSNIGLWRAKLAQKPAE
jgi:hypothetical protein